MQARFLSGHRNYLVEFLFFFFERFATCFNFTLASYLVFFFITLLNMMTANVNQRLERQVKTDPESNPVWIALK
jgi:hypothetical protein